MRRSILRFFLSSFLILAVLLSSVSVCSAQGVNWRFGKAFVSNLLQIYPGARIDNKGYYAQTYSGTFADAFKIDYTGSGNYILNLNADGSPVMTLTKSGTLWVLGGISASISIPDTDESNYLTLDWGEDDTADRVLDFRVVGANRILTIEADSLIDQDLTTDASVTFDDLDLTGDLDIAGHVAIGADSTIAANMILRIEETDTRTTGFGYGEDIYYKLNPGGASSGTYFGTWNGVEVVSGNSQDFSATLWGTYNQVHHRGIGTIDTAIGIRCSLWNDSTGDIGAAYGQYARVRNDEGDITAAYAVAAEVEQRGGTIGTAYGVNAWIDNQGGSITDAYGMYVRDAASSGTITNLYGLYLEEPTKGGTLNYSIYSVAGDNYLGGSIVVGTTKLHSTTTTLSAAQVNACRGTPITVVAAQGANTWIELVSAVITYDYDTAAFTVAGDEDLVIEYADGTDATASIETTGFLDQTDDEIRFYPNVLAAGADIEASINQALRIFNTGGGETADGGSSEVDVRVTYRVYNTGF